MKGKREMGEVKGGRGEGGDEGMWGEGEGGGGEAGEMGGEI